MHSRSRSGSGRLISFLKQNITAATLVQLAIELSVLFAVGLLAIHVQEGLAKPLMHAAAPALAFAVVIVILNGAFGIYRRHEKLSSAAYILRLCLAPAIGVPLAYLIAEALPGGGLFQQNLGVAFVCAFAGLLFIRHTIVLPLISTILPHRVMVLGTGAEASMVEASLAAAAPPGMRLVGFHPLEKEQNATVSRRKVIARTGPLEATVKQLGVNEIIVAVREQRGGVLPLRSLLECRLNGVQVTDLARFFERVHGRVPIDSLKVSWLIYGEGYRQDWARSAVKRAFDVVVALMLLVFTLPIMAVIATLITIESKGPIIYRQDRVGHRGREFTLLKFRSMDLDAEKDGKASWATVNDARVTRVGRLMRRTRVDELPQLINVLRGEMSFVGPRPERPEFVAMLTEQIPFYAVRHSVKPGITGWAQVRYSYGATVEQAVKKLEYDLYYVKNHTLLLDMLILIDTVRVVMLGEGAR
jgi:sugar transferase (PEP-CTERM system associated)